MFPELTAQLGPIYFWLFAAIAVFCGTGVLMSRHPINGTIYLIGVMLSLSGLYAILHSPFVAVLQVLVYAGAIMMLVVFVIMVLNQAHDHMVPRFDRLSLAGIALPLILGALVLKTIRSVPMVENAEAVRGEIAPLAQQLFTVGGGQGWYLLFEIGGLLLLAAVVGAVLLAKRHLDSPVEPAADAEPAHGDGGGHP